jgi:cell division septation protein DedD
MADRDDVIIDDDSPSGVAKWVPTFVVMTAFGGFIALAWYAYHTGTQSMNEEDLVVVEADKTPMKEKPLDPGGMKFMNQDKTIYDTFSANQANPPKVEHVMPAPEEPLAKPADSADTKTWINDKLHQETAKKEQVIGEDKQKPAATQQIVKPVDTARVQADSGITTHVAETKPADTKAVTTPAAKKPEPAKTTGTAKIQLGAYGSEEEAKNAWGRMQKKYPELADKTVYIVKADLGGKGIFYRLRAGGIGDAAAAKALCAKLSAKGQACLVP